MVDAQTIIRAQGKNSERKVSSEGGAYYMETASSARCLQNRHFDFKNVYESIQQGRKRHALALVDKNLLGIFRGM